MEQVTIGAIEGFCIGGGAALAVALDFRIMGRGGHIRIPEIALGMNMSWQSVPRMLHLMGPARTKQAVIIADEKISAQDAYEWRLVEQVVDDGKTFEAAMAFAEKIARQPPIPVAMTKLTVNRLAHALDDLASHMDRDQYALASLTDDHKEGVASFLERRKPRFKGQVKPMVNLPVAPAPFRHRLVHLADRLAGEGGLKIVAIGSSTTHGEGDITPYPARLQDALKARYPKRDIKVVNKGQNGQEAPDELKRFQQDVLDEKPDVVIWQVGTNAVWHGDDLDTAAAAIRYGLDLLADLPMDVVVMDLQYLPAVLTPDHIDAAERMVALIADAVATARGPVNLFKRFAYMRDWHELERRSFDSMVDPTDRCGSITATGASSGSSTRWPWSCSTPSRRRPKSGRCGVRVQAGQVRSCLTHDSHKIYYGIYRDSAFANPCENRENRCNFNQLRGTGGHAKSNSRAGLSTRILCCSSASARTMGMRSTRSPSFGITLTFGCGQSVPQITRSGAVSTSLRANGMASWNGGPAVDTRSKPEALTQHFGSRCISSSRILNGRCSSPSDAVTRAIWSIV